MKQTASPPSQREHRLLKDQSGLSIKTRSASGYLIEKRENTEHSKLVWDLAKSAVIDRAIEVIGDPSEAMRWLGTPVRALDYAIPVSLLHNSEGRESVLAVLGRLENGVM